MKKGCGKYKEILRVPIKMNEEKKGCDHPNYVCCHLCSPQSPAKWRLHADTPEDRHDFNAASGDQSSHR